VFPNPAPERDCVIRFDVPDRLCVETKSLKRFFWSYRDEGAFHQKVTNTIVDDLVPAQRLRTLPLPAIEVFTVASPL
jgi:7-cyano-7-deazaguanine reductase